MEIVQSEGERQVTCEVEVYNLSVVSADGTRTLRRCENGTGERVLPRIFFGKANALREQGTLVDLRHLARGLRCVGQEVADLRHVYL